MKAIILAGGKGTRLSKVVSNLPKPLAPVQGEPFLFILLRFLRAHGIEEAMVSVHHLSEKFEEALPAMRALMPKLELVKEPAPLGTGGAVRFACRSLKTDDHVLVMNGDTYFDFDLGSFVAGNQGQTALALKEVADTSRYGTVKVANGNVVEFVEKRPSGGAGLIYSGSAILNVGDLLRILPEEGSSSLEQDFFPRLLQEGKGIKGETYPGRFIDIGIPEDYHFANTQFDFSRRTK